MMRLLALLTLATLAAPAAAQERATLAAGALVCGTVELAAEHARIVRLPSSDGIEPFVRTQVRAGTCRVIMTETPVTVLGVDPRAPRGFARIAQPGQPEGWTDAESIWGYFDAAARVKAWPGR
jgi:hypothetical protein